MPIIKETLNINNLRATSAKSINLHTTRSKGNAYSYRFRDIAVRREAGIVTLPAGHRERKGLML